MKTTRAATLVLSLVVILSLVAGCTVVPIPTNTPATASKEVDRARQTLTSFFAQLNGQHYQTASSYYGGSYDALRDWNPAVAPDDYTSLWRNGCTINGLQCLIVKNVVYVAAVSEYEFQVIVEFAQTDGSTFVDTSTQTQFQYTVAKKGGEFLVMEMPIYMP